MSTENVQKTETSEAPLPAVWKRFYFVRRNPAISLEEFPARWGAHGDLGGTFPDGLKRHPRTNYGIVRQMRGGSAHTQYDGIGMLWLGSPEWADRASSNPLHRPTMQQDELRVFHQLVYDSAMLTEQHTSKPGPLSRTAVLRFINRVSGSEAAFGEACKTIGSAMSRPEFAAQVTRCTWGTVVRSPTIAFNSFMEFWFATPEHAAAALESEAFMTAALTPLDIAAGSTAADPGEGEDAGKTDRDVIYLVEIFHERVAPGAPS